MASDGAASRVSSGFSVCVRYPLPPPARARAPTDPTRPERSPDVRHPAPDTIHRLPVPLPPSRSESMTLRDEATGECLWRADPFPRDWREREIPAILPARVLRSDRAVVREVRFVSNASRVDDLTVEQEVVLASRGGGGSSKGDAGGVEPPAPGSSEPSPPLLLPTLRPPRALDVRFRVRPRRGGSDVDLARDRGDAGGGDAGPGHRVGASGRQDRLQGLRGGVRPVRVQDILRGVTRHAPRSYRGGTRE